MSRIRGLAKAAGLALLMAGGLTVVALVMASFHEPAGEPSGTSAGTSRPPSPAMSDECEDARRMVEAGRMGAAIDYDTHVWYVDNCLNETEARCDDIWSFLESKSLEGSGWPSYGDGIGLDAARTYLTYDGRQFYLRECVPAGWPWEEPSYLAERRAQIIADNEIRRQYVCLLDHLTEAISGRPCGDGPGGWTDAYQRMCGNIAHDANNMYRYGTPREAAGTPNAWERRLPGHADVEGLGTPHQGLDDPVMKAYLAWYGENCR